jgi:hypothetical protein
LRSAGTRRSGLVDAHTAWFHTLAGRRDGRHSPTSARFLRVGQRHSHCPSHRRGSSDREWTRDRGSTQRLEASVFFGWLLVFSGITRLMLSVAVRRIVA